MPRSTVPYGLWPSPISPQDVAAGARRFGLVQGDGPWVYWTEGRPAEKGRQALLRARASGRGEPEELLPAPWSARSRVHEYGGGEFLAAGDVLYFVNDADQDVYELTPGKTPRRLTNAPGLRFADFAVDRARERLLAVAERHVPHTHAPENLIVVIALGGRERGTITELVRGRDFYAAPRLSPDGRNLAFVTWDLPGMPWDEAELMIAELDEDGAPRDFRNVAGGQGTAATYPAFAPDGTLVFVTDASDFGRIALYRNGRIREVKSLRGEYGRPMWTLASSPFTITNAATVVAASVATGGRQSQATAALAEIDVTSGRVDVHEALPQLDTLSAIDGGFVALVSPPDSSAAIQAFRFGGRGPRAGARIRRATDTVALSSKLVSKPAPVTFRNDDGDKVQAFYYAPTNPDVRAPTGTRPPALVLAHGGPTSMANRALTPRIQFYTSRGFAVLDVDYAGSTGYGRTYRERLDGQWGIADVADCAAGARFLATNGLSDPTKIAIAGGSAGGYTVLMALATTNAFAAGSAHYGISDLSLLMEHTHKFEAGYLHRLLGTTPKAWRRICRQRSPMTLIDGIEAPLILFQGLEDRVVPPEQSRLIHERLKGRGIATELHEFAGEGHGFRRAETIIAVLESELRFLRAAMKISV